jgi:hypothetical protein
MIIETGKVSVRIIFLCRFEIIQVHGNENNSRRPTIDAFGVNLTVTD